jgi:hypothetical protein
VRTRGGFGTAAFGRLSFEKESALKSLKKLSCHCDHPKRQMSTPNKPNNKKYDPPSPLCSIAGRDAKPKTVACICKANDPINEQRKTVVSALQAKTRDVATSPPTSVKQRTAAALKSPKVVIDGQQFSFEADAKPQCSPRKASDAHKLVTASPEVNKLSPAKLPNTALPTSSPRLLEKSNSLGESRPQRQLRTTRSLSPRPPVRHQHSIMVCDENDVVSIKLSPHEDFDAVFNKNKVNAVRSACASPKFSTPSSLKIQYKQQQNKSTSCLEYIPTDPWKKMAAAAGDAKPMVEAKTMGKKSMSRPNLEHCVAKSQEPETSDPWIWRSTSNITETVSGDGGKSAGEWLYFYSILYACFNWPRMLENPKIRSFLKPKIQKLSHLGLFYHFLEFQVLF